MAPSESIEVSVEKYLRSTDRRDFADPKVHAEWSSKRWVWVADKEEGYVAGTVVSEDGDSYLIQLTNGSERKVRIDETEKMNPPKFEKVEDMAELSYLNEASVLQNLKQRSFSGLVYTYSGLFLVAVNPYKSLPIYSRAVVDMYRAKRRIEMPPHIFAVADNAYHDMLQNRENQSILITGESGAGKTENTKKVIQYLAAIAGEKAQGGKDIGHLEQQILQSNPILEAFGNAQTTRNNNSSRFGKFIRIEFNNAGQIAGANIESYLLEKSRVTHQGSRERNFHVFYQLFKGASADMKQDLLLDGSMMDYRFLKDSRKDIEGVDDAHEFSNLNDSFSVMGIAHDTRLDYFRTLAIVLHLGNIRVQEVQYQRGGNDDIASIVDMVPVEKACHLMGVSPIEFSKALLRPSVKAGREWVQVALTASQVEYSIEALARSMYFRMFMRLVDTINQTLDTPRSKSNFIGVLDITGFEIFEKNSFEQLMINHTNERLQQFFNHHMFVREQEEYKKEGIEWKFIDFGLDLQPTIDLIEKSQGIFSLLDEECVMPQATDKTLTEKLHDLWVGKNDKYAKPRFEQGFILKHYAGVVEYLTHGWLDKNKDPLNQSLTVLLGHASNKFIGALFAEYSEDASGTQVTAVAGVLNGFVKKGAFRTVSQRHKEQLQSLISQLHTTQPHFVRCIIPNEEKRAGKMNHPLVLNQLRCNGVLEGIRICRQGYPNRVLFQDFRQRYEILAPGKLLASGFMDSRKAAEVLLAEMELEENAYKLGLTKIFFRANVLGMLEERRDSKLSDIMTRTQACIRSQLALRWYRQRLEHMRAIRIIQRNARIYVQLREWSWWRLYSRVKPLLNVTRVDEELRRRESELGQLQEQLAKDTSDMARLRARESTLEMEKKALAEALQSERYAAAGQEERLARLQQLKGELEGQLREMAQQSQTLEEQLEASREACEQARRECQTLQTTLETEQGVRERLDKERHQKESHWQHVEGQLQETQQRLASMSTERRAVEAQLMQLTATHETAQQQTTSLERQWQTLQTTHRDLEDKCSALQQERTALLKQRSDLEKDVAALREQCASLQRDCETHQQAYQRKEEEVRVLSASWQAEQEARQLVEKQRRELTHQWEQLSEDLTTRTQERDQLDRTVRQLQSDLERLTGELESAGDASQKHAEVRRIREDELSALRASHAADKLQSEQQLADTKQRFTAQLDLLSQELATSQRTVSLLERTKCQLEGDLSALQLAHAAAQETRVALDKAKRAAESELQLLQLQVEELQRTAQQTRDDQGQLSVQLTELQQLREEQAQQVTALAKDKGALQRALSDAQEEVHTWLRKGTQMEEQRRTLQATLEETQAALEAAEQDKALLDKTCALRSSELEGLRERLQRETVGRAEEWDTQRRTLSAELQAWQQRAEESARQCAQLDKTRARLTGELEDMTVLVEREHQSALNADKKRKLTETQLQDTQRQLEEVRHAHEALAIQVQRLQASEASLQHVLEDTRRETAQAQRARDTVEQELRALVSDIGEGGKHVHELDKTRKRLETQVVALQTQLTEAEDSQVLLEETRLRLESQLVALRQRSEQELREQTQQFAETKRMLMREVNTLGEQLETEMAAKAELLRMKKRMEGEVEQLRLMATEEEEQKKRSGELDKMKRRAEQQAQQLRELRVLLESEQTARANYEEMAQRQEKKSHALATELESCTGQLESQDKVRRQLEGRVQLLEEQLHGEEEQRAALLETRRRLEQSVSQLQEDLEDAEQHKRALENARRQGVSELDSVKRRVSEEMGDQLHQLEEQRKALQVQQRVLQSELEERQQQLGALERTRAVLQADLETARQQLQQEAAQRAEEASAKRRAQNETRDAQQRVEYERAQAAELQESVRVWRSKAETLMARIESLEMDRGRMMKSEDTLKQHLTEREDALQEAVHARRDAEERMKRLEMQAEEAREQMEEGQWALSEAQEGRRRVQLEMEEQQKRVHAEMEEREAQQQLLRQKHVQELQAVQMQLNAEKAQVGQQRAALQTAELSLERVQSRAEEEARAAGVLRKDKARLETRVQEQQQLLEELQQQHSELSETTHSQQLRLKEARGTLEALEAEKSQWLKSRKGLELELEAVGERLRVALESRLAGEKRTASLDSEAAELRELLEEMQDAQGMMNEKLKRAEQAAVDGAAELAREQERGRDVERQQQQLLLQVRELQQQLQQQEQRTEEGRQSKRMESKVEELQARLDEEARERTESQKSVRRLERQLKEQQMLLSDEQKLKGRAQEEAEKHAQRYRQLRQQLDDQESQLASAQLEKRRMEREHGDMKEKQYRAEKEAERLRMRLERMSGQMQSVHLSPLKTSSIPSSLENSFVNGFH